MTYKDILEKVSKDTNLPVEVVDKTYKAFWSFIRKSVQELPLKDNLSEREFLNLRTNFNIPSLGKLTCTYDKYSRIKNRFENINNLRKRNESNKESKADVQ